MTSGATRAGRTKHALVAQALIEGIRSSKHEVGGVLPSEPDLARSFGVSRHTVRVALRTLHEMGLVSSRQGVGNIVRANRSALRYIQSFESVAALWQYASNTRVHVALKEEIVVGSELAVWLDCKPGERWWRIETTRRSQDPDTCIAASEIFIPYAFGPVLRDLGRSRTPIIMLIEKRLGEVVAEVRQEISATVANVAEARALGIPASEPLLQIVRRYLGTRGQVLEVSRSVHPTEALVYSMSLRLAAGISPP